jgi:hypothetical protein
MSVVVFMKSKVFSFKYVVLGLSIFVASLIFVPHPALASTDALLKVIGQDLSSATAPSGVQTRVDSSAFSNLTTTLFPNITTGQHMFYSTYVPAYTVSYGTCAYPRNGGVECTIQNFSPVTCDSNIGICSQAFDTCNMVSSGSSSWCNTEDYITKVAIKYDPLGTGDFMVKIVGPDLFTSSAPSGVIAKIDALANAPTNPYIYSGLAQGTSHIAYATYKSGYDTTFGYCIYQRNGQECSVNSFNTPTSCDVSSGLCKFDNGFTASNGQVVKVVAKYNPTGTTSGGTEPVSNPNPSLNAEIDVLRTGIDQTAATAPAGTRAWVDTVATTTSNPGLFPNLTGYSVSTGITHTHDVYVTPVSGYNISFGVCAHLRGTADCIPQGTGSYYNEWQSPTCVNGVCKYSYELGFCGSYSFDNCIYKIVFRYIPSSTSDISIARVGSDQSVATAPPGTTAKVDSLTSTSTNPGFYTGLTAGQDGNGVSYTHTVYASASGGLSVSYAYCPYTRGGFECTPANYQPASYNAGTGLYSAVVTADQTDKVYKVIFAYLPQSSSDVVIQRIGVDQTVGGAPAGGQVALDSSAMTTANPASFNGQTAGGSVTHTAYATQVSGYNVTYATCSFSRLGTDCAPTNFQSLTASGGKYTAVIPVDQTDKVFKVAFLYTSTQTQTNTNSADILVKSVGIDLSTSTSPAVTLSIDGLAGTTQNPTKFVGLVNNSVHNIYSSYIPGYALTVGECAYNQTAQECVVANFYSNTSCDVNTGLCRYTSQVTASSGQVKKVVWRYVPTSSGDVFVKKVGADLTVGSAPSGTTVWVENAPSTLNPATFSSISAGSHILYASYNPTYAVTVGSCQYPRGGTECFIGDFYTNATCDANTNLCTYKPVYVDPDKVTKVVWKYDPATNQNQNPNDQSGDIMVKRVGPDLYTGSAPGGTNIKIDTFTNAPTNPFTYLNLRTGAHTAYATYNPSYTTSFGYCLYQRGDTECVVSNFDDVTSYACDVNTLLCTYSLSGNYNTLSDGNVLKVVAKYDAVGSGSAMVKRVGSDLYTSSAPTSSAFVDTRSSTTVNPITFTALSTGGTHSAYTTYSSLYDVSFGSCQYLSTGAECAVTTFNPLTVTANNDNNICDPTFNRCRHDFTVTNGYTTKVVFKYDLKTTGQTGSSTGDVAIERVGYDGTRGTVPGGTSGKMDALTASTTNPATYYSLSTSGSRIAYATYLPGYSVYANYCTYQRGTAECISNVDFNGSPFTTTTGSQSYTCNTSTNLCNYPVPYVSANYVTKVTFAYITSSMVSSGDVQIERVGTDQTTATVPGSTQATLDSGTATSTNPGIFTNVSEGNHTYTVTGISGYAIAAGACTYQRGQTPCIPNSTGGTTQNGNNYSVTYGVSTNWVTRVQFRYVLPTTADILVSRVGVELSTSTAPAGTYGFITGKSSSTQNPALFSGLAVNQTYTAYAKNLPGYTITVGVCSYQRGTPECPKTSDYSSYTTWDTPSCPANGAGDCSYAFPIDSYSANRVFKVLFLYTPNSSADIVVKNVGTDQTVATAPSGVKIKIDSGSIQNVTSLTGDALGTGDAHTIYGAYLTQSSWNLEVGICDYQRGSSPCYPTGFTSYYSTYVYKDGNGVTQYQPSSVDSSLCNSSLGTPLCKITFNSNSPDRIYVVIFHYTPVSSTIGSTASNGYVYIKRVGADLYASSAPAGTDAALDTSAFTSANPASFTVSTTTQRTAYAKYAQGFRVTAGTCTYVQGGPECSVTSFNNATCDTNTGLCSYPVSVTYCTSACTVGDQIKNATKVVFKYDASESFDIKVKRVGGDLYTASAPVGTYVSVDTGTSTAVNPATFNSLPAVSHSVYGTYLPQSYVLSVGECQYPRLGTECSVTTFSPVDSGGYYGGGATCDENTGLCKYIPTNVTSSYVTKVVWKYDLISTNAFTLTNSGDISVAAGNTVTNLITATKAAGAPDATVTFAVSGLPNGATATFNSASCNPNCTSTMTITASAATQNGTYQVQVFGAGTTINTRFSLTVGNAARIVVQSVTCDAESYLPNWQGPAGSFPSNRPSKILQATAQSFIAASNGHCWFDPYWGFQWGYSQVSAIPGDFIGSTTVGSTESDWKNFDSPTGLNGVPAIVDILNINNTDRFWVRENLKSGYVAFTMPPYNVWNNVSAEMFCNGDGYHYDNYDYIISPQNGTTYYCIGFNALASGGLGTLEIKRVDAQENATPIASSSAWVDSTINNTTNPAFFPNITIGSHTAKVADLTSSGFTAQVGVCTYPVGSPECSVTAYNPTPDCDNGYCPPPIRPVCDGTYCSLAVTSTQDLVTKVVFKYMPASVTPPTTLSCYVAPGGPVVGSTVRWSAVLSQPGNYNYSWSGTDGLTGNSITTTKTYASAGQKSATVTVSGDYTGTCTQSVNVGPHAVFIEI